jgi:ppGpp synthetase/RelA/SpoT-type nucleotidyltranferase
LREEYFNLLPDVRRVLDELEADVRHCLIPISIRLDKHEKLVVTSRIKECESALDSLRRRQESPIFDRGQPELYSLGRLNDLAGVRVLAFPAAAGWKPTGGYASGSHIGRQTRSRATTKTTNHSP